MRSTFDIHFNKRELDKFDAACTASISKLGKGTRKALVEACEEISTESRAQVPYDTGTLALSQFWEITGNYKTGWNAVIGYGGNGDPKNPFTLRRASSYAVAVHEDTKAHHPLGKAKFLEDPLRAYAAAKFPRTVFKYAKESLAEYT